jgi:ribonuclease BN (tRNA processing enzyme)
MELIVLGSSGAFPAAGGAAAGYLVRHDGFRVWMDAGTGTFANLQLEVAYDEVDAVLVTHEHVDHCIDLYPVYIARFFHPEPLPPLPLYAPKGVFERLTALEDAQGAAEMRGIFDVREIESGQEFEVGPFRVRTRLLPHWVPNLGLRLEADGASLVYTGDTGPTEELPELARDADLLVSEASWLDVREGRDPYHLTAGQAGEHAARAGAARLLLSHFWPGSDRGTSGEQASAAFDGEVLLASEGSRFEVNA